MKKVALGITLATHIGLSVFLSGGTTSLMTPLVLLLPLAATFTLLAADGHLTDRAELLTLLLLLCLGLGFMMLPGGASLLALGGVFIVLIVLLFREQSRSRFSVLWGIGLYGFALAALFASFAVSSPTASTLLFIAYAILLPTCPLHGASIVCASRLRGIPPNFLALFLPILGLHGALGILPDLPSALMNVVSVFALIGALYGGIRAVVQTNIRHRLAYAALSFWSILWWYLASPGMEAATAMLYLCALGLIMQGLFVSVQLLEKRHGLLNLDQLGGLAQVMPRFGVLLSLLVAAGMGLPLFGSFTALLAMATSPATTLSWGFVLVLLAWLLSSWHFPLFMQRILMGPPKPDRIYRDLDRSETLSLTLIVVMIVILGIAPQVLIGSAQTLSVQKANSRIK